jgi:hypothetical protein
VVFYFRWEEKFERGGDGGCVRFASRPGCDGGAACLEAEADGAGAEAEGVVACLVVGSGSFQSSQPSEEEEEEEEERNGFFFLAACIIPSRN